MAHDAPKMMKSTDKLVKDHLAARPDLKMLTEKHNDEKLAITFLIVGVDLIAYHFWWKNKWHHYYSQSVVSW